MSELISNPEDRFSRIAAQMFSLHCVGGECSSYPKEGSWWPDGRASDSESRGPGFDLHMGHSVVSLSKSY